MYEYIKGIFKGIQKEYIVIENNGIGYKIFTSGNTMAKMPSIDDEIILYVTQIVRQDFIGLYGFSSRDELELFLKLTTVNGVGAKSALSLLSIASPDTLKRAIVNNEEKLILKAPGIGKKSAGRIILELKDKFTVEINSNENTLVSNLETNEKKEAKEALMSLGYSLKEAQTALDNVDSDLSLEITIKMALQELMK